ncbi:CHAT domain-containing protein [Neotabrizicola sp. VNH66]|uniref:CHAT domain-containing protein n=1 Tax=Neotabrizicola sp. VNH66 TaxID=3400918 RepID=UPI003BFBBFC2
MPLRVVCRSLPVLIAVSLTLLLPASVPAQIVFEKDLPAIPFGRPDAATWGMSDPILWPHWILVDAALKRAGAAGNTPQARAGLAAELAAVDGMIAASVAPNGRQMAEWLALTLWAMRIAQGPEAAMARADRAVAVERQLAVNGFVLGDYLSGAPVVGAAPAAIAARAMAVDWAMEEAAATRAAGDAAGAARLEGRAFFWAQTLVQGAAARAGIRTLRDPRLLARIDALAGRIAMVATGRGALTGALRLNADALASTLALVQQASAQNWADMGQLAGEGVDFAATLLPRPLSLGEVQALLGPDEALVLMVPGGLAYHLFVVTAEDRLFYTTAASQIEVDAAVEGLLRGVGAWNSRGAVPLEDQPQTPAAGMADRAHWLYAQILGPAAGLLDGKSRLYLTATGSGAQLPWAMMVASPPAAGAGYGDLDWLIRHHAIHQLPAVELLLQPRLVPREGGLSYLGLGAPDYTTAAGTWAAGLTAAAVPGLRPLPEAAGEVRDVGALYPEPRRLVLTGAAATEDKLYALSDAGQLRHYDVLHFATHGLIWGDDPRITGDGLIALARGPDPLPPPGEPLLALRGRFADGALHDYEIRGLRLEAALVILSACKTAAGQAFERDGVTGLAAAFLQAGADRVLATHWPVNSRAAVNLVTAMMAADPALSDPAGALRGAILAEIAAGGRRADPAWWGPFSLIGAP